MNKKKRKEYNKRYKIDNKEKIKEQRKEYHQDNKEKWKEYYQDNKEKINERDKQYYQDNKEKRNEYTKQHHKKHSDNRRHFIDSFKHHCLICGYRDKPALVFHHRDPREKTFAIASKRTITFESFQKEIDKCTVLCSNCHLIFHHHKRNPSLMPKELLKKYLKLGLKMDNEAGVKE